MTITVFHINRNLDREQRLLVTFPIDNDPPMKVSAKRLFDEGGYDEVAKVSGDNLEYAFSVTNNVNDSWSRNPAEGVSPAYPGYMVIRGKPYGYKSSEVGDIFRNDETGKLYVVASFGFEELP